MAADNQMDPASSRASSSPSRAARSSTRRRTVSSPARRGQVIPRTRYLGNAVLSLLTKIASGYWHVADSQAGYTALSLDALRRLDLGRLYPRYGFPNDMLVHLNVQNARVRDVPSRPIYDVGERSGIKLRSVVPRISWLLFKGFWWRMGQKYVIRDFHPLVFFYVFGVLMLGVGFVLGLVELVLRIAGNAITPGDDRPRRRARHRRAADDALRDVVRHGGEQGPPLSESGLRPERVISSLAVRPTMRRCATSSTSSPCSRSRRSWRRRPSPRRRRLRRSSPLASRPRAARSSCQQADVLCRSLQGLRRRRPDVGAEGAVRDVHRLSRHGGDVETEVTGLLADSHTGQLGAPSAGRHLLGAGREPLRRQVLAGEAPVRAERRPHVDRLERRSRRPTRPGNACTRRSPRPRSSRRSVRAGRRKGAVPGPRGPASIETPCRPHSSPAAPASSAPTSARRSSSAAIA